MFGFGKKKASAGYVVTFLGGVVAGGALALLFAPMTGKKMQKKVVNVAEKVIDKVDDLGGAVRHFATA